MNRLTGRRIDATSNAHVEQSMGDILTTPLASRVVRRPYGSGLPDLIDGPVNPAMRLRLFAAAAQAILRWEPRVRLRRIQLAMSAPGSASLRLQGVRTDLPRRPVFDLTFPLNPTSST